MYIIAYLLFNQQPFHHEKIPSLRHPWLIGSAPCATQPRPAFGGHAHDHRFTTGQQGGCWG